MARGGIAARGNSRRRCGKNAGGYAQDLRRRREEEGVQLRNLGAPASHGEGGSGPERAGVMVDEMVSQLYADSPELQIQAIQCIGKLLLQDPKPPIDDVLSTGMVPMLVPLMQRDDHIILQYEAAWCLSYITGGTSLQTWRVVKAGAVPVFVCLLSSEKEKVRELAVVALGNIAVYSSECCDYVLDQGTLMALLELFEKSMSVLMKRQVTWALSNLCWRTPRFEKVQSCLPILLRVLFARDPEVLTYVCRVLSYLSYGPNHQKQVVIDAGVCKRLVKLLTHKIQSVVSEALQAIGHIVTGDDVQIQEVINCNALPCLLALLSSPEESIRKNACWTLSNITAGNQQQIQAVIDANIFPVLAGMLSRGDLEIQKEAARAITNAISGGSPNQVRFLVQQKCIDALCELLSAEDQEVVQLALNGLDNVLRLGAQDAQPGGANPYAVLLLKCFGMNHFEFLQSHEYAYIYPEAFEVIKSYINVLV
ncbi:hypothetical protein HPB51_029454 [Rhipicephalus microplus]|uniref:Importin subunit alpha n=1 Tax=Rhipicephalus microplus TaxID=6941 RepID=A0A9J6CUT7_RHIMP|nr:importin subunit alpha-7-like [Rhipicephalus microplus]KAH7932221.1 hypothetical protein HPB51_029454 [Rhipicephalus microplus]